MALAITGKLGLYLISLGQPSCKKNIIYALFNTFADVGSNTEYATFVQSLL